MKLDSVRALVGNTPHVRARFDEAGIALHVKLEGQNPTGSIKDRAAVAMLEDAERTGRLRDGVTVLDASSGNMACALAYFARVAGHPATVVASSKLTAEKGDFIRYFGAELLQTGNFTIEGNRLCREMAEREPDRYCFLDQLHNPCNPAAHHATTGPEILRDFAAPALVAGSLGSGGSLAGTARYLKERSPSTWVVAVQSAPGTRLPGTGSFDEGDYVTPFITEALEAGWFDEVVKINEADAVRRTQQLREQGIFGGLQTGGVVHAALVVAAARGLTGDAVAISGDAGWKNMQRLLAAT